MWAGYPAFRTPQSPSTHRSRGIQFTKILFSECKTSIGGIIIIKKHTICGLCYARGLCVRRPSRNCCVVGLFKEKEKATREEIVQYCCVERCHHGVEYHNTQCPIKLVGINGQHPLNPFSIDRLMHVQTQQPHTPDDNHQKQLSDF